MTSNIIVKAKFGDDLRRTVLPQGKNDFTAFSRMLCSLFPDAPQPVVIKYIDDEDDEITMSSQQELDAAVSLLDKSRPLLRVVIYPKQTTKPVKAAPSPAQAPPVQQQQPQPKPAPQPQQPQFNIPMPQLSDVVAYLPMIVSALSTISSIASMFPSATATHQQPPASPSTSASTAPSYPSTTACGTSSFCFPTGCGFNLPFPLPFQVPPQVSTVINSAVTAVNPTQIIQTVKATNVVQPIVDTLKKIEASSGVVSQELLTNLTEHVNKAAAVVIPMLQPAAAALDQTQTQAAAFLRSMQDPAIRDAFVKKNVTWVCSQTELLRQVLPDVIKIATAHLQPCISSVMSTVSSVTSPCSLSPAPSVTATVSPIACTNAASSQLIHWNVICDCCDKQIVGVRYKCQKCSDYDLCSQCEPKKLHDPGHTFEKIEVPRGTGFCARTIKCTHCSKVIDGARFHCTQCPDVNLCADCESKNVHDTSHVMMKLPPGTPTYFGGCGGFGRHFGHPHHQQHQQQMQQMTPEQREQWHQQRHEMRQQWRQMRQQMAPPQPTPVVVVAPAPPVVVAPTPVPAPKPVPAPAPVVTECKFAEQNKTLVGMGFKDEDINNALLALYEGDLESVIKELISDE